MWERQIDRAARALLASQIGNVEAVRAVRTPQRRPGTTPRAIGGPSRSAPITDWGA